MSKEPPAFQGETKVCNDCGWGVYAHLCPVARFEGPGLDAPSLDEGLLALALYEVDGFGLLSECRETARDIASVYRRLAQEGETP